MDLSIEEFQDLQEKILNDLLKKKSNYVYGMKGLADLLNCSLRKAHEVKKTGILDSAIHQRGHTIVINKKEALKLFNEHYGGTTR